MRKFHLLLVFFLFLITSCVTDKKYRIYELEGVPSNYFPGLVSYRYINYGQKLKISGNNDNSLEFDFTLFGRGRKRTLAIFHEVDLETEPYDLWLRIYNTPDNTQKIIFNKMLLKSKNTVIDIRKNVKVTVDGRRNPKDRRDTYHFSEEGKKEFGNSGIIDSSKFDGEFRYIDCINIWYNNIDVKFNKDSYFTIEYDIIIETGIEDIKTENYCFTAKFIRKRFSSGTTLPALALIALVLLL